MFKTLLFALLLIQLSAKDLPTFSAPPIDIIKPKAEEQFFGPQKVDLKIVPHYELTSVAADKAQKGQLDIAIQLQYWACELNPQEGKLELARYYAAKDRLEDAVYTIQQAAILEGVNDEWINEDPAFKNMRKSKHWLLLKPFLKNSFKKWTNSNYGRVSFTKSSSKTDIILVGLHGYGSKPEDFSEGQEYQKIADRLNTKFLSVSATLSMGKNSFRWSENLDKDFNHINSLLKIQNLDLSKTKKKVILIGFSQGAQLSVELAARYPDIFSGAIIMCPGLKSSAMLNNIQTNPDLSHQRYIIINGSKEKEKNLHMGKIDKKWLEKHKAKVIHHIYDGMDHSFPQLYYDQLSQWIQFICK